MKISDKNILVQKAIQKIVDMPEEKVTKVLIFMAGMDAEQAINSKAKKSALQTN